MVEVEQKVITEKTILKEDIPVELHKRIVCHWGGEVDYEGMLSPYETAGYIYRFFNQENFEGIKKHIDKLVFLKDQKTEVVKKAIVLDNGNWQLRGFDNKEEAIGFLMVSFSPQTINNMVHQAMNQVPSSLRKVKEIDMIFKAIYDILARLEGIEKSLEVKK